MRRRTGARAPGLVAVLLAGAVLTGCGGGSSAEAPWRAVPEGEPPRVGPPASPPAPLPGDPAEPRSDEQAGDPNVVASGLSVPTGLVVLPDGTAIVGERDTGRLLQVFPDRSPARELMTVPGLDTAGDGGLLGLALSPSFLEDGLVYAYVSTATDNRVVRFPIGGTPNPVLTGLPRGPEHNGGGLLFGADGSLYVGTGDAGDAASPADPASLGGAVLRIDVFGRPVGADLAYSRGHRNVTGLCQAGAGTVFATDEVTGGPDELDALAVGGEPAPPAGGVTPPAVQFPAEEGGLGGCAATPGTGGSVVFLGALDGQRVHVVGLDEFGALVQAPEEFLTGEYGRLRSLALDTEGALWITTSNRDGVGSPAEDDDKVLRILPPTAQGSSPL